MTLFGMIQHVLRALCALVALAALPAAAQVRIVVLGSSTAEGVGPASPDSAWVARYRAHVLAQNPQNEVVNLARGGYTTYHVLPTGAPRPAGRPASDAARNLTRALALAPDAIVVNLPSNDAASGYSVAEQLANYRALVAAAAPVPVWITTTQPRALNALGRANLMAVRDSTLITYGSRALDFWAGIARETGLTPGVILPQYDAGDGIHLNAAAHRILFQRVVAAGIPGPISSAEPAPERGPGLVVVPNPWGASAAVTFWTDRPGDVSLRVYDLLGREVGVVHDGPLPAGLQRVRLERRALRAGVYVLRLRHPSGESSRRVVLVGGAER